MRRCGQSAMGMCSMSASGYIARISGRKPTFCRNCEQTIVLAEQQMQQTISTWPVRPAEAPKLGL